MHYFETDLNKYLDHLVDTMPENEVFYEEISISMEKYQDLWKRQNLNKAYLNLHYPLR